MGKAKATRHRERAQGKDRGDRKDRQDRHLGRSVQIWTAQEERAAWAEAATAAGMSLSAWLRHAAREAVEARKKEEKARMVERLREALG